VTPTGSSSPSSGPSEPGWSRLRTGAALIAGLALALAAIFFSDVALRELSEGPALTVTAAEARDLEPGAAVWVAGVPAGRVTSVRFREAGREDGRPVVVRAVLREGAAGILRADASAQIRASALLAPPVLALDPGRAGRPFDPGDTLRAEPGPDREEIRARTDSLAGALAALAPLADSLRTRLDEGPGTLAALRRDGPLRADLRRAGDRVRALTAKASGGSAAKLAGDTVARAALGRAAERLRRLAEQAGDRAAPADSAARALDALLVRLDTLSRRLDAGRGTAGRLLRDRALQRERRRLEAGMDSLRAELLADPLRWLRFRLF
jgi:phospholipid/cholesterol/gamma-HCH transport system substrate-binding protein